MTSSFTETVPSEVFCRSHIRREKKFLDIIPTGKCYTFVSKRRSGIKKKRERKERNIKQTLRDIMKLSWYMPCLWVKTAIILLERGKSAIKGNFRVVLGLYIYVHLDVIVLCPPFTMIRPKYVFKKLHSQTHYYFYNICVIEIVSKGLIKNLSNIGNNLNTE